MLDLGEAICDAKDSVCCGSHLCGVAQFVGSLVFPGEYIYN
jgi:hypothetical protein